MKTKLIIGAILLLTSPIFAASDRFGNERTEVPRSTFTFAPVGSGNVAIATVTIEHPNFSTMTPTSGGDFVLRRVILVGNNNSTVTFFDDSEFDGISTTRTIVEHLPVPNGDGKPTQVDFDMYFSSGLLYNQRGDAPLTIMWDWLSPRKSGDDRK